MSDISEAWARWEAASARYAGATDPAEAEAARLEAHEAADAARAAEDAAIAEAIANGQPPPERKVLPGAPVEEEPI